MEIIFPSQKTVLLRVEVYGKIFKVFLPVVIVVYGIYQNFTVQFHLTVLIGKLKSFVVTIRQYQELNSRIVIVCLLKIFGNPFGTFDALSLLNDFDASCCKNE